MKRILFLFFILISRSLFSQNAEVIFDNGTVEIKNIDIKFIDTVFNNKTYKFPSDWKIKMGSDSILLAYPGSWKLRKGKDGHLVAYPNSWKKVKGPDGRIVAYPYREGIENKIQKITEKGPGGKKIICLTTTDKKINKYGIYTQTGSDKRLIAYTNEMSLSEGADGRLINIPENWEISQSEKGRLLAYPKNWELYEIDDKQFAMPEGWKIDFDTDSPEIQTGDRSIKFIFTPVEKYELAEYIYNKDIENGLDYLIYLLVNE